MSDADFLDGFYLTLEEEPGDRVTLLALADWYDERDAAGAAACLRWCAERGRRPYRYRRGALTVHADYFHDGWFWWAVQHPSGVEDWGFGPQCRLPPRLWGALRHTFAFKPSVVKQYATTRAAYEALIEAWPAAGPTERRR